MIINVYSVYDLKARCYSTPFFQHNDGVALRSFIDLVNDTRSAIYAHAEDYTLNQIGTFNDDTGELISVKPKTLVTAASVQEPKEDPRQMQMPLGSPGKNTVPKKVSA